MKTIYKLFFIVTIILIVSWLFAWPQYFVGDCMEPVLKENRYIFLNRAWPYFRNYKIGDIVAFKYENKNWIARVAALENDSIQISEGNILINGKSLEDKVKRNWANWKYGTFGIEKSLQIPAGHLYVLSDNLSAHHDDSRVFGPISKRDVIGLIW